MLWLYQRRALKAFRASVGDEEGYMRYANILRPDSNINSDQFFGGRSGRTPVAP